MNPRAQDLEQLAVDQSGPSRLRFVSRRVVLAGLGSYRAAFQSQAQATYPERNVTIVVPFAPGGASDFLARLIADRLGTKLGRPFVVQNQVGAGGNVGSALVARAASDGHTLLMASSAIAVNQGLHKTLPFDVQKDFTPVCTVALIPNVLAVHPSVPAKTLQEFIAYAHARPGELNYGTPGIGSVSHLATELLAVMAGIRMTHVPFRGSAPAVTALLGGQVQVMLDNMPPLRPHIEAGTVRALGIATTDRDRSLPDLPTISEGGVAGFEATSWQSLLAPAGVSEHIVALLHREISDAVEDSVVRQRIEQTGAIPHVKSPKEFQKFLSAEVAKWAAAIKQTKIEQL